MNIKSKFIIILITVISTVLLTQCKDDDGPADYCDVHWTLNQDYLENLLFDYENTDTLLYKRTINNVVTDTLVFVKQRSYQDVLLFSNNAAAADPNCGSSRREFTREVIGWDYSSQFDSIFFNVKIVASGEGQGFDDVSVQVLDTVILSTDFFFIGNFGVNYESNYETSEGIYDYCWRNYSYNKDEYDDYGTIVQDNLYKTGWQSYYNIEYGIVEIFRNDRTEVWELIP